MPLLLGTNDWIESELSGIQSRLLDKFDKAP